MSQQLLKIFNDFLVNVNITKLIVHCIGNEAFYIIGFTSQKKKKKKVFLNSKLILRQLPSVLIRWSFQYQNNFNKIWKSIKATPLSSYFFFLEQQPLIILFRCSLHPSIYFIYHLICIGGILLNKQVLHVSAFPAILKAFDIFTLNITNNVAFGIWNLLWKPRVFIKKFGKNVRKRRWWYKHKKILLWKKFKLINKSRWNQYLSFLQYKTKKTKIINILLSRQKKVFINYKNKKNKTKQKFKTNRISSNILKKYKQGKKSKKLTKKFLCNFIRKRLRSYKRFYKSTKNLPYNWALRFTTIQNVNKVKLLRLRTYNKVWSKIKLLKRSLIQFLPSYIEGSHYTFCFIYCGMLTLLYKHFSYTKRFDYKKCF